MKNCENAACNECSLCKSRDVEQRLANSWEDVELFRIVKGRLPNQDGDDLTKSIAKEFIDRFAFGSEEFPSSSMTKEDLSKFAFHVYSSTNLAYKNDIKNHGTKRAIQVANTTP